MPPELKAKLQYDPEKLKSVLFSSYNKQTMEESGFEGLYDLNVEKITPDKPPLPGQIEPTFTLEEYKSLLPSADLSCPSNDKEIDTKIDSYWANLKGKTAIYASDVDGSLFSDDLEEWNINKFTAKESRLHLLETKCAGIHTSYLYIGSNGSSFSYHTEDLDANSMSLLHLGAPKVWIAIARKYTDKFEAICADGVKDYAECTKPLRHKTVFVHRDLLAAADFEVTEVSTPNCFIIPKKIRTNESTNQCCHLYVLLFR